MKLGLAIGSAALAVAASSASVAQNFNFGQTSSAIFSSALYAPPTVVDNVVVQSVAGWDLAGRKASTQAEVTPVQPGGFRFDQDHALAWTTFEQPMVGADATLRSYALLSGYYLNATPANAATNEVALHDSVQVTNAGPAARIFKLVSNTGGTLVSGGTSNSVTASASEQTTYLGLCQHGCYELDGVTPLSVFAGTWSGSASVFASDAVPTVTVGGDWVGATTPTSRTLPFLTDPVGGIELHSLLGSQGVWLAPGASLVIDVDFHGDYSVTSGSSGFLSAGEADFRHTGTLDYVALDPVSGLRATDVTVTLLSAVPWPPSAYLLAAGLLLVLRRTAGTPTRRAASRVRPTAPGARRGARRALDRRRPVAAVAGLFATLAVAGPAWALPVPLGPIHYSTSTWVAGQGATGSDSAYGYFDIPGNGRAAGTARATPEPEVIAYAAAYAEQRGGLVDVHSLASMTYAWRPRQTQTPPAAADITIGLQATFSAYIENSAGAAANFSVGRAGAPYGGETLVTDSFLSSQGPSVNRTYATVVAPDSILWVQKSVACSARSVWDAYVYDDSYEAPTGRCNAGLDPYVFLDQAAFDRKMGDRTFPLADYYELEFSPGILNRPPVPEAGSAALLLAGLALLAGRIRRERRRGPEEMRPGLRPRAATR